MLTEELLSLKAKAKAKNTSVSAESVDSTFPIVRRTLNSATIAGKMIGVVGVEEIVIIFDAHTRVFTPAFYPIASSANSRDLVNSENTFPSRT